jgi:hypothetical protein
VTATISERAVQTKGLGGTPRYRTQVRINEPSNFAGSRGSLSSNEQVVELLPGDKVKMVISLKPSYRSDEDFSATLKHILSVSKSNAVDYLSALRDTFSSALIGVTPDAAALVSGLAIGDDSKLSEKTKNDFKIVSLTHLSAVSGANCAIVLAGVVGFVWKAPWDRFFKAIFPEDQAVLATLSPEDKIEFQSIENDWGNLLVIPAKYLRDKGIWYKFSDSLNADIKEYGDRWDVIQINQIQT